MGLTSIVWMVLKEDSLEINSDEKIKIKIIPNILNTAREETRRNI
jgi:hypothetical protein